MNIKQAIYKNDENNYRNHFLNYKRNLNPISYFSNTENRFNINNISLIDKIKINKCLELSISKKGKFLYSNKKYNCKIFQMKNLSRDNINDQKDLSNNFSKNILPKNTQTLKKKLLTLNEQKVPIINNKIKNENVFLNSRNSNDNIIKYNSNNNFYLNKKNSFKGSYFNCLKNLILSKAKFDKSISNKKNILSNENTNKNASFFNKYPRLDLLVNEYKKKHEVKYYSEHINKNSHYNKPNYSTSKNSYDEEETDKLISMIKKK